MSTGSRGNIPPPITGPPLGSEEAIGVKQVGDVNVITTPSPGSTLTAQPSPEDPVEAQPVYVAGTATVTDPGVRGEVINVKLAVDELEGKADQTNAELGEIKPDIEEIRTDADATRIALQSIDAKTLAPLATEPAEPYRFTATNVAMQLPNTSYPRGFTLKNRDASANLYWGKTDAVTTGNGYEITPGEAYEFDLPNSNLLWVISASTTACQIGATT